VIKNWIKGDLDKKKKTGKRRFEPIEILTEDLDGARYEQNKTEAYLDIEIWAEERLEIV